MPDIQKMLVAAGSVKQQYDEFILRAKVTKTEQARAAAHLCLTICELFDATTCLIENGFSSHSPILVRSMLEGMADLSILVEDATHLDQIAFESAKSTANTFERIAAYPDMQDHSVSADTVKAAAAASVLERDLLKEKGFRTQKIEDKLMKAGLGESYASYRLLCGYAHNDLTTLSVRHSGPDLRYHHEAPDSVTSGMLQIAFRLLTEAVALLPKFSNIQADELIAARIGMDDEWTNAAA
ncbi:DUF5677 domain-containing protein [Massilia sp. DWR3-1-1]|uniref:DUF5677 domain-containing protein n=1 Tax=Massilia sp. DWR3-1-1 TaxID=2804559 RepID=UPI003CF6197A